jgi:adenylate cyclase
MGEARGLAGLQKFTRHMPSAPRCKLCLAPFNGVGGFVMRRIGFERWDKNPNLCSNCFRGLSKLGAGGAEVPTTIFFADVRDSTTIAESMSPAEFSQLMQRFYVVASNALADNLAILDKFVGDGAIGLFVPGIAGQHHAAEAIAAAKALLHATGHGTAAGPWLPVGIGIHSGVTFVGAVGVGQEIHDITALGDPVNTAARLSGAAAAGEILVSDAAAESAGLATDTLEHRTLQLKGKTEAVGAVVLHAPSKQYQGEAA